MTDRNFEGVGEQLQTPFEVDGASTSPILSALGAAVVSLPIGFFATVYWLGVTPIIFLKCLAKWFWSANPTAAATSARGMPVRNSVRAFLMRACSR